MTRYSLNIVFVSAVFSMLTGCTKHEESPPECIVEAQPVTEQSGPINYMRREGISISDEQAVALITILPVLKQLSDDPELVSLLWHMARKGIEPTHVTWQEAQELIRSGTIREIVHTHHHGLVLSGPRQIIYITENQESDIVRGVVNKVDPEEVFIRIGIE